MRGTPCEVPVPRKITSMVRRPNLFKEELAQTDQTLIKGPISANHSSGRVLRRPTTLSPLAHWPRLRSKSTRSKRLRTFLFLRLEAPPLRKLRCWDMINGKRLRVSCFFQAIKKEFQIFSGEFGPPESPETSELPEKKRRRWGGR